MSAKHDRPSVGLGWWMGLALTLPLLYILGLGPIAGMLHTGVIPDRHKIWLVKFYAPPRVAAGTHVEVYLSAYVQWWAEVFTKP